MPSMPLDTNTSTVLDGAGNGTAKLGPNVGVKWEPSVAGVSTSTSVKTPECSIYVGGASSPGQLVDSTFTGNSDSTGKISGTAVFPGQYVWAVWTGGDPGATATLSLFGNAVTNYRGVA